MRSRSRVQCLAWPFHRSDEHDDLVFPVHEVEFVTPQLVDCETVEQCDCRQSVSVGADLGVWEWLCKEVPGSGISHAPHLVPRVAGMMPDLADTWDRGEKHASRLEDAMNGPERGAHIGDTLQNLGQDDAIKGRRGDLRGVAEIGDNGRQPAAFLLV